ncbi:hypothetical protein G6F37_003382 [Rhizopus arrhizus]|nr:hypothetical protein G6F38_000734 [Rhizopus arrhizus]KAG1161097.1 hypothetical protein G6F37_003382 [Rhizopus arrhizus]
MSVPVAFNDIGKSTRDLLNKDYPIEGAKVEVKTNTSDGKSFKFNSQRDSKTGIMFGDIEAKYINIQKGITWTGAWTTSNQLNGKIELQNDFTKGVKFEILATCEPFAHGRLNKVNATHKRPSIHTTASIDLSKSIFNINSVFGSEKMLVGAEVAYNIKKSEISHYNTAIAYSEKKHTIALHAANNLSHFTASYYKRLDNRLETTGKVSWDKGVNGVGIEIGVKKVLDETASVKGKIKNTGIVGISYTQLIQPKVKINLAAAIDTMRLNQNAHRIGFALMFEN